MLRLLLKSGCFLMLSACAVCAQEAAPATQPAPQRESEKFVLAPSMAERLGSKYGRLVDGKIVAVPDPKQEPAQTKPGQTKVQGSQPAASTAHAKKTKAGKHGKAVVEEEVSVAVEPPPPPTPEQLPAKAPQVTYREGLLSINSQNSTLGDILNAVRRLTGGTVDASGTTLSERIATRLGPAPPRDVLASLFSGSRFDYIILGSSQNPGGIDRIILTPRQGGTATAAAATAHPATAPNAAHPPATTPDSDTETEEDNTPEREQGLEEGSPNAVEQQAPPQQAEPQVQQPQQAEPQVLQQAPTPNAPDQQNQQQPKSPEQLLQELQEMQRQRQAAPPEQGESPR